jgi:hypothetical protein
MQPQQLSLAVAFDGGERIISVQVRARVCARGAVLKQALH